MESQALLDQIALRSRSLALSVGATAEALGIDLTTYAAFTLGQLVGAETSLALAAGMQAEAEIATEETRAVGGLSVDDAAAEQSADEATILANQDAMHEGPTIEQVLGLTNA